MRLPTKRIFILFILAFSFIMLFSSCTLLGIAKNKEHTLTTMTCIIKEEDEGIIYDGQEKILTLSLYEDGKLITTIYPNKEHEDLVVLYEDNINAGSATVTIYPNETTKKYKGFLSTYFLITRAASIDVDDTDMLVEIASSSNYYVINLAQDIKIEKDVFKLSYGTTLNTKGYNLDVVTPIRNYGTINLDDTSTIYCHSDLYNEGYINSNSLDSNIYFDNTQLLGNGNINQNINIYTRNKISAYLNSYLYQYTSDEILPQININADESEYEITYSNNINVGEASIKIASKYDSKIIYGETFITFTIKPTIQTVKNDTELNQTLLDPNNTLILLNGSFSSIDIPNEYTFNIGENTHILGNLTNNGTLITKNTIVDGNIINNGNFTNESGTSIFYGKVENNSIFKNNANIEFYGEFKNNNSIENTTITSTLDIFEKFINNENSTLTNNGTIFFENLTENYGDILNNTNATIFVINSLSSSKDIDNNGLILSDVDLTCIRNNGYRAKYIRRKPITDVDVQISSSEYPYNGRTIKPTLQFSNNLTTQNTDYIATTTYVGNQNATLSPINPGDIDYVISFNKTSKSYTGTITLHYSIVRGTYTITTTSDLVKAFANSNYAVALIDTSLTFTEDISIPENTELLISENGSVIISGNIEINGTLTNNGKVAFKKEDASQITLVNDGVFNNNSNVYFNNIAQDNCISGNGNIFTRTKVLYSYIQNLPATVEFNTISSFGVTPTFDLIIDDVTIEKNKNYNSIYENNTTTGNSGRVTVKAYDFSEILYGEVSKSFTIVRGEVTVTSFNDFKKALSSTNRNSECNFHTICLGASITRTIKNLKLSKDNETITIPANTIVDCKDFRINLVKEENASGKFTINNSGTIITKHAFNFNSYSGDGKIYGYAYTTTDLGQLTEMCHEVYVTNNLTETGYYDIKTYHFNTIVDLCGYTIKAGLNIRCQYKTLKIMSTDTKGTIEGYALHYSIKIDYLNSQHCITLENLIIKGGINYGNYSSHSSNYITTINCTITS